MYRLNKYELPSLATFKYLDDFVHHTMPLQLMTSRRNVLPTSRFG